MRKLFSIIILLCGFTFSYAQPELDSIENRLRSFPEDTNKVKELNALSRRYFDISGYEKAIRVAGQSLGLAEKLNFKKGAAQALNNIGISYYKLGDYNKSLDYHFTALKLREETGDKKDISISCNNIGNVYEAKGDYARALEYKNKGLQLRKETGDKKGIAVSYNNIANLYYSQSDYYRAIEYTREAIKIYEQSNEHSGAIADAYNTAGNLYKNLDDLSNAIEYYSKSMVISKKINDISRTGGALHNIGTVYFLLGEGGKAKNDSAKTRNFYDNAEKYYLDALEIFLQIDAKLDIAQTKIDLGTLYSHKGNFQKALEQHFVALKIMEAIGNKFGIASSFIALAETYQGRRNYDSANHYAIKALSLAGSIGTLDIMSTAHQHLSENYERLSQPGKALFHYRQFILFRDSISNVESAKKMVLQEAAAEYQKREQLLKLEQEKQNALAEAGSKRQKIIIWSVVTGLLMVAVFSVFILNRFRVTRKQKEIIEVQKEEVEKSKLIIEEKNKDITGSIRYAQRIQQALLASDSLLKQNLPEHFVLYKPKDIVSGDFYWAQHTGDKFLLAACDCTGHGVPGAFMSLLNINFLNQAVIEKKITRPDLILEEQRKNIIRSLNPEGNEEERKDGMDCVLCSFDFQHKKVEFACANNPLWLKRNHTIEEFFPDKMPVGMQIGEKKPFTLHSAVLQKGDTIYIFSDGYADQFGGPNGKKFKYKQLEQLLLSVDSMPLEQQRKILEETIERWKGGLEQLDDILMIGIRI